jgi:hypothetical protein
MMIKRILGATRVLGKEQGYLPLPVRDVIVVDSTNQTKVPAMETAWEPTPVELERLNRGGTITMRLFGSAHPPVLLFVEDPS